MKESYLGIDFHKKWCVFAEIDSTGKLLRQGRFGNTFEEVSTFASSLTQRVQVVLEPVLSYLWLLDQLEPYAGSVHVATPHKVRVIAESKSKTDRYDARMLAELLRTNFLPESWVPPAEIRSATRTGPATLSPGQIGDHEQEPYPISALPARGRPESVQYCLSQGATDDPGVVPAGNNAPDDRRMFAGDRSAQWSGGRSRSADLSMCRGESDRGIIADDPGNRHTAVSGDLCRGGRHRSLLQRQGSGQLHRLNPDRQKLWRVRLEGWYYAPGFQTSPSCPSRSGHRCHPKVARAATDVLSYPVS